MKLLLQPKGGVGPILKAIGGARRRIDILIFRFDIKEVERALTAAVERGVVVRALIAHTNRAGEGALRRLEMRLLAAGVTVSRTAGDLLRYHAKLLIIDERDLYLLAFNFTHADMERSRSFGVVTRNRALVAEAARLIDADSKRQTYEAASESFVVSPVNARKLLAKFIKGAKKQLLIYDPKISDPAMLKLLEERAAAGVEVRLIGKVAGKGSGIQACKLQDLRLHTRTMVRDGQYVFVGSQSLRALELDGRREAGILFRDLKVAAVIRETFEADWAAAESGPQEAGEQPVAEHAAKKMAKAVVRELPDLAPVVNGVMQEVVGEVPVDPEQVQAVVKDAVKAAVKEAVAGILEDVAVAEDGK